MSNPQGPDRSADGTDGTAGTDPAERTGELPVWGTPPAGGWGGAGTGTDGAADSGWDPRAAAGDTARDAGWDPRAAQRDAAVDGGRPPQGGPQDPARDDGWGAPAGPGGWGPGAPAQGGVPQQGGPGGPPQGGSGIPPQAGPGETTQAAPLWGDEAPGAQEDTWAIPTGRGHARPAPGGPVDAVPAAAPTSAWPAEQNGPGGQQQHEGAWGNWTAPEEGEEPWAPRDSTRRSGGTGLWLAVGGAVLVAAVVAVTAFLWPAWAVANRLDQTALQTGVGQVLSRDYGVDVGAVQCPADVEVAAGTEFTCQAVVDNEQVPVHGIVTSDNGDYQVKRV